MASSRAALWAAAVDGGFSKGEAFVSQMPDGKNPENPGFSWALVTGFCTLCVQRIICIYYFPYGRRCTRALCPSW